MPVMHRSDEIKRQSHNPVGYFLYVLAQEALLTDGDNHTFINRLILKYLIPCRLLRGSLPSQRLLRPFPSLSALYLPFVRSFRRGDVRSYDEALSEPRTERALVEAGTYLAMERGREGCLRGLFRRVYQAKEKQTRISIDTFHRALRFVGVDVEPEETEWFVAQQIAKGYMRGYISHERQMTVLSAQNAFPSLHTVTVS